MLENIRLSFRGIWSHKMRSFLTMLGIIIGIAAIISIVSTIKGTNEQIKKNLIGSGSNTVKIELQKNEWNYDAIQNFQIGLPTVSTETMENLAAIKDVESVSKYVSTQTDGGVFYLNNTLSGGFVLGVDSAYLDTTGMIMKKGRGFSAIDFSKKNKVAILDGKAVEALFSGENPLGKKIEIQKEAYVVIGVYTELNKFEPVINSMEDYETFSQDISGKILIPDVTWPTVFAYDNPEHVVLGVTGTDAMTAVGKQGTKILNAGLQSTDKTIKYKAVDLLEQAKKIQSLSQSTNAMLLWIAGISLIVGGIGVMNIMLVTVTERTREIGLKKAIGARKSTILWQFLTEAAVLTSIGGVLGVLVGIGLAKIISIMMETPIAISVPASMLAVIFSMLVGIVFGILPSKKAANLDPIEALRAE